MRMFVAGAMVMALVLFILKLEALLIGGAVLALFGLPLLMGKKKAGVLDNPKSKQEPQ